MNAVAVLSQKKSREHTAEAARLEQLIICKKFTVRGFDERHTDGLRIQFLLVCLEVAGF